MSRSSTEAGVRAKQCPDVMSNAFELGSQPFHDTLGDILDGLTSKSEAQAWLASEQRLRAQERFATFQVDQQLSNLLPIKYLARTTLHVPAVRLSMDRAESCKCW